MSIPTIMVGLFLTGHVLAEPLQFGPEAFTAAGAFPTSVYGTYYNDPTQTASQVQPKISDPITVSVTRPFFTEWISFGICSTRYTHQNSRTRIRYQG